MTNEEKQQTIAQVAQAWVALDALNAAIMKIGEAAYEAGDTLVQHQLEVIHHNLAKVNRELVSTISQINHIKGE
jgi:bifunctional pyridoxal-dependent enzyme with beta-cystathionase and maltose regulon repressor activities